jgi:hypothetical protein
MPEHSAVLGICPTNPCTPEASANIVVLGVLENWKQIWIVGRYAYLPITTSLMRINEILGQTIQFPHIGDLHGSGIVRDVALERRKLCRKLVL